MSDAIQKNRNTISLHKAIEFALLQPKMRKEGIETNVPYIVSAPGAGKTRMLEAALKRKGWGYLVYTPGLERVEKFGGIPDFYYPDENDKTNLNTVWSKPEMICQIDSMAKTNNYEHIVVLFDDWHLCASNIQQIGFELFTHYSLNSHKVPKNVSFVLAGNEKSAAGAKVQMSAIRNRCTMLFAEPDVTYWIQNFAIPNKIHNAGISFFNYNEYQKHFHEDESTSKQWASPRSWTSAFNKLSYVERLKENGELNYDQSQLIAMLEGDIGPEATSAFMSYYTIYININAKQIFQTGKFKIPEKSLMRYAFASAISDEFYDVVNKIYFDKSIKGKKQQEILQQKTEIFSNIMQTLSESNLSELVLLSISQFVDKNNCEQHQTKSGSEILSSLLSGDLLGEQIIVDIQERIKTLRSY